jgi:hypothetical protein
LNNPIARLSHGRIPLQLMILQQNVWRLLRRTTCVDARSAPVVPIDPNRGHVIERDQNVNTAFLMGKAAVREGAFLAPLAVSEDVRQKHPIGSSQGLTYRLGHAKLSVFT